MKQEQRIRAALKFICHFLTFFLLVAFVTTCCMTLFLSAFTRSLQLTLNAENLSAAAKLTFGNVLLLSLLFTLLDTLRRRVCVRRPVQHITGAAERLMRGDFSVRVETQPRFVVDDAFGELADCFNRMAQELQSVQTLRTDFIANVSHEMKTPLAVMQNYATLLQTPELTEQKRREYACGVSESARRMADMMTNILKLNRLENQKIFPEQTQYDLTEQLCECLLQYETVWEREGITLQTELEEGVRLRSDGELLRLVWNNLFSNAFKFTGAGGTVSITLVTDGDDAVVCVQDTGCGMSAEVGQHIFEKFYQGDTSHSIQGNGLGLALVKRVVDILHGEISVESTVGVGSTFAVRVPGVIG